MKQSIHIEIGECDFLSRRARNLRSEDFCSIIKYTTQQVVLDIATRKHFRIITLDRKYLLLQKLRTKSNNTVLSDIEGADAVICAYL